MTAVWLFVGAGSFLMGLGIGRKGRKGKGASAHERMRLFLLIL